MAKVVSELQKQIKLPGKYPWAEWLDGRAWELTRGVDFRVVVPNFRNMAYSKAKSLGKCLSVAIVNDTTIQIQAYEKKTA